MKKKLLKEIIKNQAKLLRKSKMRVKIVEDENVNFQEKLEDVGGLIESHKERIYAIYKAASSIHHMVGVVLNPENIDVTYREFIDSVLEDAKIIMANSNMETWNDPDFATGGKKEN